MRCPSGASGVIVARLARSHLPSRCEKVATALSVVVADMPDNVSGCSEVSVRRRNSHRDCESMSVSLKKWSRVEQTELVEGLRSLDS